MWHRILDATSSSEDRRREVSHALATNGEDGGSGDVAFAERLM